jgi:hypothetical protein
MARLYKPELTALAQASAQRESCLRSELKELRLKATYGDTVPAEVAERMKQLEADIAWEQNRRG